MAAAKAFARAKGYLNVQEFVREAARAQMYEVRPEYLASLQEEDATTFLSEEEAAEFEKRIGLTDETKKVQ